MEGDRLLGWRHMPSLTDAPTLISPPMGTVWGEDLSLSVVLTRVSQLLPDSVALSGEQG